MASERLKLPVIFVCNICMPVISVFVCIVFSQRVWECSNIYVPITPKVEYEYGLNMD